MLRAACADALGGCRRADTVKSNVRLDQYPHGSNTTDWFRVNAGRQSAAAASAGLAAARLVSLRANSYLQVLVENNALRLTDTTSMNDILSRFSVVSAKVSLLERANDSDARPLARLTSNNTIIQTHNGCFF